jgi:hypothetical protein
MSHQQLVPSSRHLVSAGGGALIAAANVLRDPEAYQAVVNAIPVAADYTRSAAQHAYNTAKRWLPLTRWVIKVKRAKCPLRLQRKLLQRKNVLLDH